MTRLMITCFGLLLCSLPALAADTPQTDNAVQMQEAMKAWTKYATPSDAHKKLAEMTGQWKYTSKFWMSAEAKPEESKGTSSMKKLLGGRFISQETKGKAMGQPFEGMGLVGYDNLKERYETLWMDNMGTGIIHGSGTYDAATKTLKDSGEYSDPTAENKTRPYRGEWVFTDKNHMTYSMWTTGADGKEFKQMEMAYLRNQRAR